MPFKPSNLTPDDDLNLPDDLRLLGEQLRDDARWLATKYPAGGTQDADRKPQTASLKSRQPKRFVGLYSVVTGLAAALILLVLLPAVVRLGHKPVGQTATAPPNKQSRDSEESNRSDPRTIAAKAGQSRSTTRSAESVEPPNASPALLLQGVSGPELEGLLDLLQFESPKTTRLSI